MTEFEVFKAFLDLVQSFGIWIVFFALYWYEKKAHEETRRQYRSDLREVAGFQSNVKLERVTNTTTSVATP